MQSLIFCLLLAVPALALPHYEHHEPKYATVPVVHNKIVGYSHHTPVHTVQKVHHTVHPISIPVHHPSVTTVHHEPTAVLAKAPKVSGFAFKSEVRHDAKLHGGYSHGDSHGYESHAAPISHGYHSDAGHGYGHGAVVSHAAPISHGYGHESGYESHGYHHQPAPYVSSKSLHVAPAKIIETPSVSSYKLETGRIDTETKQHYGIIKTPVKTLAGYQTIPVHTSHNNGYGSHY